jgi:hypothetical protein
MKNLRQSATQILIAMSLLLGVSGAGLAADLYSLPTEDGLELFLLENRLQAPSLDLHASKGLALTLGEDGAVTFSRPDSFARHFGVKETAPTDRQIVGYQGFRTSPLGRVLNVEGRFQPDLGPATMQTADSGQLAERRLDLGTPRSERGGWEDGHGMRILSF